MVTADVGCLVDSPVVAAVETAAVSQTEAAVEIAAVAIADLSQVKAAVMSADPDSAAAVRADHGSVPAVPVAADKTIFDPAASYHAIDAWLKSYYRSSCTFGTLDRACSSCGESGLSGRSSP